MSAAPAATAASPAAPSPAAAQAPARRRRRGPGPRATYRLMVAPALVAFLVLHTLPVVQGIFYSFTDSPGYGGFSLVGINNYLSLFTDPRVLHAYGFTFFVSVVATVLTNVVALGLAVGLNARIRFRTTLRAVFFVPNVLATLVVGYVFTYLFSNSLPALGQALGIDALSSSLLSQSSTAWIPIVVLAVWQSAAMTTIIYLAGLQTVPEELHEAASLDGASAWRRFRSITLPMIAGFLTVNAVLSLKGFLQIFDHIMALTGGGPGTDTESVALLIYKGGFQSGDYGYQSADSVVFMILIVVLSLVQLRFLQKRETSL